MFSLNSDMQLIFQEQFFLLNSIEVSERTNEISKWTKLRIGSFCDSFFFFLFFWGPLLWIDHLEFCSLNKPTISSNMTLLISKVLSKKWPLPRLIEPPTCHTLQPHMAHGTHYTYTKKSTFFFLFFFVEYQKVRLCSLRNFFFFWWIIFTKDVPGQ